MQSENNHLVFRIARENEAGQVLALYHEAAGREYCTWNEAYPGVFEIRHDMETGNLFILENDGNITGAISIVPENELDELSCWRNKERANEIARVVIHTDYQGKGYSVSLVKHALDQLRQRGCQTVHLSVAAVNIPAQKTYQRLGFTMSGECDMYGSHYYLYEKAL